MHKPLSHSANKMKAVRLWHCCFLRLLTMLLIPAYYNKQLCSIVLSKRSTSHTCSAFQIKKTLQCYRNQDQKLTLNTVVFLQSKTNFTAAHIGNTSRILCNTVRITLAPLTNLWIICQKRKLQNAQQSETMIVDVSHSTTNLHCNLWTLNNEGRSWNITFALQKSSVKGYCVARQHCQEEF